MNVGRTASISIGCGVYDGFGATIALKGLAGNGRLLVKIVVLGR